MQTRQRNVVFLKAGKFGDAERVFLTTHDRLLATKARRTHTIFHCNRYSTFYRFPVGFFRANFCWDRRSGVYRTSLTYGDVSRFAEVVDHGD
jgi:hypothetical protein